MHEEHDLPKLAQAMRERGLNVYAVTTIDQRYIDGDEHIPGSIAIAWRGEFGNAEILIAEHVAQPITKLWHVPLKKYLEQRQTVEQPLNILNKDGTVQQTYVVGEGWVDVG